MTHNDQDIKNAIIKPIEKFFQDHKKYFDENSDINFDPYNINYSFPIQRIIKSKTFKTIFNF